MQAETNFCQDTTKGKLYNACDCEAIYRFDCRPNGANQGITPPAGTAEVCLKQFYLNDALQGIQYYRSCTCKSEYNQTCAEDGLTPDLYIGLSSDYCEISYTDEDGAVTTSKKYKQCQCPTNYRVCPSGTTSPEITTLSPGQYCIEVNDAGAKTTKYSPDVCQCSATTPDSSWIDSGFVDTAAQTTYKDNKIEQNGAVTLTKDKLDTSNQEALKRLFLDKCVHEDNGLVKGDGCGKLYYKCLIDPETYPFSNDNCPAPKTLQGETNTKTGWSNSITLYKNCDCPTSWYTQEMCDARSVSATTKCQVSGETHKSGSYMACANIGDGHQQALKLYGNSCVNAKGETVKELCECNTDVFTYRQTGIYPYASCIDGGADDKVNKIVWVCYFDNVNNKNVVCPTCKTCSWNNVVSSKYHISRSFEAT